jgi:hypothetical protein
MRYFDVWAGDTTTLGRFENTLLSIMESSCPFNPDRQLRDTHFVFCCYNTKRLHEKLAAALIRELKVSDSASTSEIRFSYGITDGLKCMLENYPGDQQLRWYALYRGGIPNSDQKNWDEQKAMIPEGYSVPSLWVAAQACMMHGFKQNPYFRQPGMRLSVGRVTDEIAPGNHLNVGTDFGINMKVGCNPRWFYDGDATRLPGVGIWAVREL